LVNEISLQGRTATAELWLSSEESPKVL